MNKPTEPLKPINIFHVNGIKYYQFWVNNDLLTIKA
jgi:hypothetical protein